MSQRRAAPIPERIRWAVAQLELAPRAQVLEIGCGAGQALALVAERLPRGAIVGIDRSAVQVRSARQRNAGAITAGRVRVERLALDEAPAELGERSFHAVFAINVNSFWTHPEPSIEAARQLLRKRGQLYLCYEPPGSARLESLRASLPALLKEQGARVLELRAARLARNSVLCVIADLG